MSNLSEAVNTAIASAQLLDAALRDEDCENDVIRDLAVDVTGAVLEIEGAWDA